MLGGATQAMPLCIVEERQQRRRPLAAAPLRAAARWPGGLQQSANVILWRALGLPKTQCSLKAELQTLCLCVSVALWLGPRDYLFPMASSTSAMVLGMP